MEVGDVKKAFCRICLGERNCEVKGFFDQRGGDRDFSWSVDWFLLQCRGCDAVFCQTVGTDSESYFYYRDDDGREASESEETVTYWPAKAKRELPVWMLDDNTPIRGVDGLWKPLNEVYGALDNDLTMLATIGVRTVFDVCAGLIGIPGNLSFKEKLEQLAILGKIGQLDKENLETLVEAGNASAHQGWLPKEHELSTILDILEHFVNVSFVEPEKRKRLDEKARKLKDKVPPRQKKAAAPKA